MRFDFLFWHELTHQIERAYYDCGNRARDIVRIADRLRDTRPADLPQRRSELLQAEYTAAKQAQEAAAAVVVAVSALRQSIADFDSLQDKADTAIRRLQEISAKLSAEIREPGSEATQYDRVIAALDLAIPFTTQDGQFFAVYTVRFLFEWLEDDNIEAITRALFKEGRAYHVGSIRKPSRKAPNFAVNCRLTPEMRGVDVAAKLQTIIDNCRANFAQPEEEAKS